MNYTKWILGTALVAALALTGCVKYERVCTMADGSSQQINVETCPDFSTLSGTGTGSGTDTATLERPLAVAAAFGGGSGMRMMDLGGREDMPAEFVRQTNGKLVVVGHSNYQPVGGTLKKGVSMTRIDPTTGESDLTFAVPTNRPSDGILIMQDPAAEVEIAGAALHPSSGAIVAGYTQVKSTTDKNFGVMIASATGQFNFDVNGNPTPYAYDFPSFGSTSPATRTDVMKAIGIDSANRIVMVGSTNAHGNEQRIGVIRIRANDMAPDFFINGSNPGFGYDQLPNTGLQESRSGTTTEGYSGYTVLRVLGAPGIHDPNAMVIDSANKIVIVGKVRANTQAFSDMFITRLDANGVLDSGFTHGIYDFGTQKEEVANAVALQSDGKIVVGGYAMGTTVKELAMFRTGTGGVIDTSFGTNGYVRLSLGMNAEITKLTMQGSKILALGWAAKSATDATKEMLLVRFNSDGSVDTTFGTSGIIRFANPGGFTGDTRGTAALWDGSSLFVAGPAYRGATSLNDMMIWRLN